MLSGLFTAMSSMLGNTPGTGQELSNYLLERQNEFFSQNSYRAL